ncbi:MAG TPA: hypothetical protein VL180_00495 [Burkholderiales bacterium]|nr:hypothetical protein [Burkholderiales bacterium]
MTSWRVLLAAFLLAGCMGPNVKEISSLPALFTTDWPADQKSAVRCIVEHLSELKWKSEVREAGSMVQVVWNGPSFVGASPIAVFDVTGGTAAKPGKIVMRVVDNDEPDRIRQAWLSKIRSCSP